MSKALEAFYKVKDKLIKVDGNTTYGSITDLTNLDIIETALKEKEESDFELEVFKLAYEWKCNGVKGTYDEVLNQARKTVEGWKQIAKKGYGTIITN